LRRISLAPLLRRKLTVLMGAAIMLASMLAICSPASAQGGCEAFGQFVASTFPQDRPAGQTVRDLAPFNDEVHDVQAASCQ
jgi:hypothetical protein